MPKQILATAYYSNLFQACCELWTARQPNKQPLEKTGECATSQRFSSKHWRSSSWSLTALSCGSGSHKSSSLRSNVASVQFSMVKLSWQHCDVLVSPLLPIICRHTGDLPAIFKNIYTCGTVFASFWSRWDLKASCLVLATLYMFCRNFIPTIGKLGAPAADSPLTYCRKVKVHNWWMARDLRELVAPPEPVLRMASMPCTKAAMLLACFCQHSEPEPCLESCANSLMPRHFELSKFAGVIHCWRQLALAQKTQ